MDFWLFENEAEMPNELLTEEGQLFETCKQCGKSLHNPPLSYSIEKVFKRYPNTDRPQVLFEYAVCDSCAMQIREEFSEESAANMQAYFTRNLAAGASEIENQTLHDKLSTCLLSQKPLAEEQEYAIVARARGDKMLESHYPFAIGVTAMDDLQELLSDKTKDLLDDFVNQNFPGPPEFETVPVDGKWVLV